ncbi:MAG: methylated-DNA--[protein]-cysteine S-methyltransferase [Rhodoferax sp.]|nr:methylated-DNA--[protein]-cysteine S-methyltransferase [Rhodoferax sp.]
MSTTGYTVFDTAIGPCGIAWGPLGLTGVQLPEEDAAATRARMERRFPQVAECAPSERVQHAIGRIVDLLDGRPTAPTDLSDLPLDMSGVPPFHQRVYALARQMAPGETTTYGAMARRLGEPGAARAVGQALGNNPFAPVVPCHRILAADGRSGGFSASGGARTKLRLLEIEKAQFGDGPGLFDESAQRGTR